jgi:hypothetical protein
MHVNGHLSDSSSMCLNKSDSMTAGSGYIAEAMCFCTFHCHPGCKVYMYRAILSESWLIIFRFYVTN